MTVNRRRIYIIPTRFGVALALLLVAMLIAGLNYNSNLGLAFGFLMVSLALVAMHHCHRNILNLGVDAIGEADAFAGGFASFEILLRNAARIDRHDIEVRMEASAGGAHGGVASVLVSVPARGSRHATVSLPVARRGVIRVERFELRTRYPFGWFRAWTYVQRPLTAFVAPRPGGDRALPSASASRGAAAQSDMRGEEEFAGLRAYEAGVPLKHMAWKVLARGGEPAVQSYAGLAAEPEWLDWATLAPLGPEARLSQLCRWVLSGDAARRTYGLRIPGTELAPSQGAGHRTACLRALARYPTDPREPA